jgi:hypothetical protein
MSTIPFRTSHRVSSAMVSIFGFRYMAQDLPEHGCKGTAFLHAKQEN